MRYQVLILEDMPKTAEMYEGAFSDCFNVHNALSVSGAWGLVDEVLFDILVVDLELGDGEMGDEFALSYQRRYPGVLVYIAAARHGYKVRRGLRVNEVFEKPFNPTELNSCMLRDVGLLEDENGNDEDMGNYASKDDLGRAFERIGVLEKEQSGCQGNMGARMKAVEKTTDENAKAIDGLSKAHNKLIGGYAAISALFLVVSTILTLHFTQRSTKIQHEQLIQSIKTLNEKAK